MKVLYFGATWCGPCKQVKPLIRQVTTELNIKLEEVDVDSNKELAAQYGVRSIPAMFLLDENNKVINSLLGAAPIGILRDFCENK